MTGLEGTGKTGSRSWAPPAGPGSPPAWLEKQLVMGWRARGAGRRREGVPLHLVPIFGKATKGASQNTFYLHVAPKLLSFDLLNASVHPHFARYSFISNHPPVGHRKRNWGQIMLPTERSALVLLLGLTVTQRDSDSLKGRFMEASGVPGSAM